MPSGDEGMYFTYVTRISNSFINALLLFCVPC